MVDPIRVNSHGLRAAQPMVAQSAGAIRATLGQLVRALDAEGACWGADATGAGLLQADAAIAATP